MKIIGWVGALAIIVGGLGCDGSGGLASGGMCGDVQPCGGAVMGSWKIASICNNGDDLLAGDASDICDAATIHLTSFTGTGTVTYKTDATYQQAGDIKIGFQLTVPMTCFATGETCADLDTGFAQENQPGMTITSHSCVVSGSSCVCTVATDNDATESGTYSTAGTTLTTTPTGGDASGDQYCIEGNTMHDMTVDMTMQTSMGTAKIVADIVLTKQ
jgi:hypothetical protein